jgi:NADH:ubiquinone oxidoreductase subunit 6 (subunit J)
VPESKTPFRIRPLTIVFIAAAVVLIVVAVVYLTMSHPKHTLLFFGLAVLALVGAWFSTGESQLRS